MALTDPEGFISGYSGEEISLLVNEMKLMALQNLSWKASQKKSPIRGAGWKKAHAIGRGPKEYEIDFEVKELNIAVVTVPPAGPGNPTELKNFMVGGTPFTSLLDIRGATILVVYPVKAGVTKIVRFTGFEFTNVEGGFSVEDEAVGRKLSGIATDAQGIL